MRKERIWLLRTRDSNPHYCKDKTDNVKNKVGPAYTCQNMFSLIAEDSVLLSNQLNLKSFFIGFEMSCSQF